MRYKPLFSIPALVLSAILPLTAESISLSDPFNTEALTTKQPQQFWQDNSNLTVNTNAELRAAQQLPQHPMSLAEITDFALRNNPNTRLAWSQAKIAAANLGIAKSTYLPQVQTGGAISYTADVFTQNSNSQTTSGPNISLSYVIWDFGNRSNNVKSARYQVIAADLMQNSQIQQVILQVEQAYYQVLGQKSLIEAYQKNLKEAQTSLDAAQALRKHGLATIGDVYQSQSYLAQTNLNLAQAEGNYQIAFGQLTTAMGLPADCTIQLLPLSNIAIGKINEKVEWLLDAAKHYRPDLKAAEAQVRSSQASLAAIKAAGLPTLQVNATAGPHVIGDTTVTGSTSSISITVPLFTGFQQRYNVRQAKAQVLAAQATRDQLNQQVEFDVWQAYYALKTAEKSIANADILLKSSEQSTLQAIGQYKSGVGNILMVLTSQTSLASARVQSVQARLSWYTALAQLAAAVGTLGLPSQ